MTHPLLILPLLVHAQALKLLLTMNSRALLQDAVVIPSSEYLPTERRLNNLNGP
ncbi:hypothetical protein DM01DRAFT_1334847 [Hesseltinella vesiculosa]|uniref:Uncharacterized protein n=1 Tax=Hesseltinella vesiculosa TaxID=101127 RepID=A0A1X2GF52_9FUNG|nr:hypothetical protein DM01DRAFT_1337084 [Hesseltinella vesiculosa]ORX52376.1 hypothetical protein DM01DRAFT_1336744 [Hesseltinella vesiculosa]ORX56363.1 hypothetical protein DM01DRAFT_1334847 [Hesseltinella vesiculosa]